MLICFKYCTDLHEDHKITVRNTSKSLKLYRYSTVSDARRCRFCPPFHMQQRADHEVSVLSAYILLLHN